MKIKELHLVHFRSAKDLRIQLESCSNILLLSGMNGVGKSTILDGLAILLSWAAARLRSPNASARRILDTDIHNDKNFSWLEITCQTEDPQQHEIFWRIAQTRRGRNPDSSDPTHGITSLTELNDWANDVRDKIGQSGNQTNVPIFVYYPVNRSVLDIPLRIRRAHTFDVLEAYDSAFTVGANFRDFFEWYRSREDIENEHYRESGILKKDPQLDAVRNAIMAFLPEFSQISVKRSPLRMEVTKNEKRIRIDQMSDGEKCLFALIGDLARRLAIANPTRSDSLNGEGIVLIDEIDLHLHPEWQRMVVRKLTNTFRNCQFIVSTHSPQVYGEVDAKCIRKLINDPLNGFIANIPTQALGLDAAEILNEEMGSRSRNLEVSNDLAKIFELIDSEQFLNAKHCIKKLRDHLNGSIPEIIRAESLITMLEPESGGR